MADEIDDRPNSQKDLELRLKAGHDPRKFAALAAERDGLTSGGPVSFAVEDNDTSEYLGVSPEYATYANETERPLLPTEGVERDLHDKLTQPLRVAQIEVPVESSQIVGVGSSDPLIYSETSGETWPTEVLKGEAAPTTVEDVESLKVTTPEGEDDKTLTVEDAPLPGKVLGTYVKPVGESDVAGPQGSESAGKNSDADNKNPKAPAPVKAPATPKV